MVTRFRALWLPLAVGAGSLALTAGMWLHETRTEQAQLRASFDFGLRQTASRIEQRLSASEQMLRGVQGFFEAMPDADERSFETYANAFVGSADEAGLQAVAYARLAQVRREGRIVDAAPILQVVPRQGANTSALGYDPLAEPLRRAAMLRARDSGNTTITDKLRLVTEPQQQPQWGFLMFVPLYERGAAIDSVDARRRHLRGWVWAAFRVGDLMASLYGEGEPGLEVRIHDGVELTPGTLMFGSAVGEADEASRPALQAQEYIGLPGHPWTLVVRSLPSFEQRHRGASNAVLLGGTLLSVLLSLLTYQLVTGRRRAHEAARAMTLELRASEARYRRILDTASEGIWMTDAAGRIVFANPRLHQMLGCAELAMIGKPLTDYFPGPQVAQRYELQAQRCDGEPMWVMLSVSAIPGERGAQAGALGMVTDVHERRQAETRRALLEAQLRESQKMEAVGTLAGGIAHDFNNILAAILGNAQTARHALQGDARALQSLAQIEKAASRARSLVQQILAFSRMQPHVLTEQPLRPVVEEALSLLRSTLPPQVELVMALGEAPLHVRADATQIQQVVMNLCTNAWHALKDGKGRIEVRLCRVELSAREARSGGGVAAGAYARLIVTDDGSGMDEATRKRALEPFFTTKPVGLGTGLGLSVVHGIVKAHLGAIHVDSTPGAGSSVRIDLPLVDAAAHRDEASAAAQHAHGIAHGQGERVLYVDDEPAMLLVVEALLQRCGYEVTALDDPRAALEVLRERAGDFDLVISDFNMPQLTGMDLARECAAIRPDLPVLITSGHITEELRETASELGVRGVLQKEYTVERLAAMVQGVVTRAPRLRSP
jgi:PAS domain S-box-containing protein